MQKLLIAGLAVASLTGIVYAQAERNPFADTAAARRPAEADQVISRQVQLADLVNEIAAAKTTCVDASGATRKLYETTMRDSMEFKCVPTFGDGLKVQGAGWIISSPNVVVF